jgi:hypothetical protein
MGIEAKDVQNIEAKPYVAPTLVHYGTVIELTKSVGIHGLPDSSPVPPNQIRTTL